MEAEVYTVIEAEVVRARARALQEVQDPVPDRLLVHDPEVAHVADLDHVAEVELDHVIKMMIGRDLDRNRQKSRKNHDHEADRNHENRRKRHVADRDHQNRKNQRNQAAAESHPHPGQNLTIDRKNRNDLADHEVDKKLQYIRKSHMAYH